MAPQSSSTAWYRRLNGLYSRSGKSDACRCHAGIIRRSLCTVPARYAAQWQDETTLMNQVAADMCKIQGIKWNGPNLTTGLFGSGDTEQVSQYACGY